MLITFEGIDGAGKTTLSSMLYQFMVKHDFSVIKTAEPYSKHVKAAVKTGEFNPFEEMLLFSADRERHVREVIMPAILADKNVICDRFSDSTYAYQVYAGGADQDIFSHFDCYEPDMTFLIDVPVDIALSRSKMADGIESRGVDYFERVREGYLLLAAENTHRAKILNGTLRIDELSKKVIDHFTSWVMGDNVDQMKNA
jgi:dTMP kinase